MILVNEENKVIMQKRNIPILDYYLDKVNMILWPRFSEIFERLLDNIKRANPKQFKLYSLSLHYTTKRYIEFVSSLYKIAGKSAQNMLLMRLTQMKNLMVEFLQRLARENLPSEKACTVFLINNIHHVAQQIRELHLEKELDDVHALEREYNELIDSYIKHLL